MVLLLSSAMEWQVGVSMAALLGPGVLVVARNNAGLIGNARTSLLLELRPEEQFYFQYFKKRIYLQNDLQIVPLRDWTFSINTNIVFTYRPASYISKISVSRCILHHQNNIMTFKWQCKSGKWCPVYNLEFKDQGTIRPLIGMTCLVLSQPSWDTTSMLTTA